jgi:hypothetical protein
MFAKGLERHQCKADTKTATTARNEPLARVSGVSQLQPTSEALIAGQRPVTSHPQGLGARWALRAQPPLNLG